MRIATGAADGDPDPDRLRYRQLGRILIKTGLLTRSQVHEGLDRQKQMDRESGSVDKIGKILVERGYITLAELDKALRYPSERGD